MMGEYHPRLFSPLHHKISPFVVVAEVGIRREELCSTTVGKRVSTWKRMNASINHCFAFAGWEWIDSKTTPTARHSPFVPLLEAAVCYCSRPLLKNRLTSSP